MSKTIASYIITTPPIKSGSTYSFTTGSGVIYEVRFGRKQNNILNATIVFGVKNDEYDGEEYSITNKGEVYQVMSTIVEVVRMYKNEHPNINLYEYTGEQSEQEKKKNKNIRLALYNRYISKVFDTDWKVINLNEKIIIKKI